MLFALDPRIRDRFNLDAEPDFRPGLGDHLGKLSDRELLRELIEDAVLTGRRRIVGGQLYATQCVADVQEAPRLAAFAVHSQRVADYGLDAEAIEHRSETLVVIEARNQSL